MSRDDPAAWFPQPWRPGPELEVPSDVSGAQWLAPRLDPRSFLVQMTVPAGFEACARLFLPFDGERTWTEVARHNGRIPHAWMEEDTVSTAADGTASGDPSDEQVGRLLQLLPAPTSSSRGWFLLWEGWGGVDGTVFAGQPVIEHAMREFHALRGPLAAFAELPEVPSYWWPDDRSRVWCADTDFDWAYLAGSAALLERVTADPVLDAHPTGLRSPARSGMDLLNDPGGTIPRHM